MGRSWQVSHSVACAALLAVLLGTSGCSSVRIKPEKLDAAVPSASPASRSTHPYSEATLATLRSAAVEPDDCANASQECLERLRDAQPLREEHRFAALAEIAATAAMQSTTSDAPPDASIARWLEVARYAYGYLFLAPPTATGRVFNERQNRVVEYYNLAVQQITSALAESRLQGRAAPASKTVDLSVLDWKITVDFSGLHAAHAIVPTRIIPSSRMRFAGLSTIFRRDGFGAEMVAELPTAAVDLKDAPSEAAASFRRMRFAPLSVVIDFTANDLESLLESQRAILHPLDPLEHSVVSIRGESYPLTANFSAGYGMWLATSSFAGQAARSLLGRAGGISRPQIFRMQRFDPKRRILLMVHGLGSSPEAWVNLANEVMGDDTLRENYQIWQVYYPTNLPIPWNLHEIRTTLAAALDAVDPDRTSYARRDMVVVGHSMGGVLARLLVSDSGARLAEAFARHMTQQDEARGLAEPLRPFLTFKAVPGIRRAVFMAAPHRGTASAGSRLGRMAQRLVRTPLGVQQRIHAAVGGRETADRLMRVLGSPSSISTLRKNDPFTQAAQDLAISPGVHYHSIIGVTALSDPLALANDGLVSYASAHLVGASSELILESDYHVQERLPAMLELRRILRLHLEPRD